MVATLESPLVLIKRLHGTLVIALLALVALLVCAGLGQAPALLAGVPVEVTLAVAAAVLARSPSSRARAFVVATSALAMVENIAWTLAVLYLTYQLGLFRGPSGGPDEWAMSSHGQGVDRGIFALLLCPRAVWSPLELVALGKTIAACRSRETDEWLATAPRSF